MGAGPGAGTGPGAGPGAGPRAGPGAGPGVYGKRLRSVIQMSYASVPLFTDIVGSLALLQLLTRQNQISDHRSAQGDEALNSRKHA